VARTELKATKTSVCSAQSERNSKPGSPSPKPATSVLLSILGQLGKKAGESVLLA